MVLRNFIFALIGLIDNMRNRKYIYIALKKRTKQTCKKLLKLLNEYNEENNVNIDFHTFFITILNYTEDDYIKLITYKIKRERKKKDRETPKKRKIDQNKLIEHGIGDTENPEYKKYWDIFTDYNENFLGDESIKGKKCLKQYFIYKYNYDEDKAYAESRKITSIIFKKKKN